MSGSLNKTLLIGNVCADPEIRRTQDGRPIANLRIATNETWRDKNSGERKEKAEFHTVVCFNEGLCKVIESYVKKGSKLYIEGSLATRKWSDQSGNDRYSTEVVIQAFGGQLVMLDGPTGEREAKPDRSAGDYGSASGGSERRREPAQAPQFYRDDEDDIPFAPEWRI